MGLRWGLGGWGLGRGTLLSEQGRWLSRQGPRWGEEASCEGPWLKGAVQPYKGPLCPFCRTHLYIKVAEQIVFFLSSLKWDTSPSLLWGWVLGRPDLLCSRLQRDKFLAYIYVYIYMPFWAQEWDRQFIGNKGADDGYLDVCSAIQVCQIKFIIE